MGKLIGDARQIEWSAARLDADIKKLQEVAKALEAVHKSLAGNQALVELGYAHAVATKRIELLKHIHQLESCSKTMYQAALLYHDFENYALGALEGKSPKEVMFADEGDEGPREKKTFDTTVRRKIGDLTIIAHNDGLLNAIVARPITHFVYWCNDVPWDEDEYISVGEAISDYFGSTVDGEAGMGLAQEDGTRTGGAHGRFIGSFFTTDVEFQLGEDKNNAHLTAGLEVGTVAAEAGLDVSNKDDSNVGWNLGLSAVKGRFGAGSTVDGARIDAFIEASAGSVSSELDGKVNYETGDVEYGAGLAAMAGFGIRIKGENLKRNR